MRKNIKCAFLLVLVTIAGNCNLLAQDTVTVFQENAAMFSNSYVFFSNGTFKHYYKTDDNQVWYGTGVYKDRFKTRILQFGDTDRTYKSIFLIHYEVNIVRRMKKCKGKLKSLDYHNTTRKKRVTYSSRKR